MTKIDGFLANQMKNPEFRKEYEALKPEDIVMPNIINAQSSNEPFYSESNMRYLNKVIDSLEDGTRPLVEHELIEKDDERGRMEDVL